MIVRTKVNIGYEADLFHFFDPVTERNRSTLARLMLSRGLLQNGSFEMAELLDFSRHRRRSPLSYLVLDLDSSLEHFRTLTDLHPLVREFVLLKSLSRSEQAFPVHTLNRGHIDHVTQAIPKPTLPPLFTVESEQDQQESDLAFLRNYNESY